MEVHTFPMNEVHLLMSSQRGASDVFFVLQVHVDGPTV